MNLHDQPRQRLALMVVAQTIDALRQGKLNEVEAYDSVMLAVHGVATQDHAGLVRRIECMQTLHEIAPDIGSAP